MSAGSSAALCAPLPFTIHASAIALEGSGILIIGPSGSGKSSLALQLMALGAGLVSDDLTHLSRKGGQVVLSCPAAAETPFGIEARGLGLLGASRAAPRPLSAIIDLSHTQKMRLPPIRLVRVDDFDIPVLHKTDSPAFPAAVLQYVRHGMM